MNETERKIEDRKLQLSSVNDELKATIAQLTTQYTERDALTKELEELKTLIQHETSLADGIKDKAATLKEYYANLELSLEASYSEKMTELVLKKENLTKSLAESLQEKRELQETLKRLRTDTAGLSGVTEKLVATSEEYRLLHTKTVLVQVTLRKMEAQVAKAEKKLQKIEKSCISERGAHQKWLLESKASTQAASASAISTIDAVESRKKDLITVEKRLRKLWQQTFTVPFPKL